MSVGVVGSEVRVRASANASGVSGSGVLAGERVHESRRFVRLSGCGGANTANGTENG